MIFDMMFFYTMSTFFPINVNPSLSKIDDVVKLLQLPDKSTQTFDIVSKMCYSIHGRVLTTRAKVGTIKQN